MPQTQQQSNTSIVNPKTVREWAMKQDLTRTLTDGHITSSLMKKAQENVNQHSAAVIINSLNNTVTNGNNQMSTTVQAGQLYSQQQLPELVGISGDQREQKSSSMLGYIDSSHSPAIQNLFSSKLQNETKLTAAATPK